MHLCYADRFGAPPPPAFRSAEPNPGQAPRHVYEAKAARWQQPWPELTVLPRDAT